MNERTAIFWLAVLISCGMIVSDNSTATADNASGFDPYPDKEKCEASTKFTLVQTSVGPDVIAKDDLFENIANVAQNQVERVQADVTSNPLRYLLYVPQRDQSKSDDPLPLVLFLHGGGEGGSDIEKVKKHGLPKLIAAGKTFPFIVVSPQNPSEKQFWDDQQLIRLLDELEQELPVDRSRVYLTGLSRGAFGAWRLAIQNPDRFAAFVSVCGGGPAPYVKRIKQMPTWVFHGAKDAVIPMHESQRLVTALKAAGGKVNFTIYPDAGHDAWTETYENPDLYRWLLEQQKPTATD